MLSVITVTFNNFSELEDTLNSLPEVGIESVVVNGGSCEKTKALLSTRRGPSVSENDKGISDAFNKGFKLAIGEYITYLNSGDVLIDKNYYKEAQDFLSSHSDIDFVYADICFVDQFAGEIRVKSNQPLPHMPFLHPTLILRRSVMEEAGLFSLDYKIAMDLDFVYRLLKLGAKGHYFPRMVVKMDGTGVSSKNFIRSYKEVFKIAVSNKDYSLRALTFFAKNGLKLGAKLLLLKSGGDTLLGKYRQNRYKLKK
jgi:glycosyltransferase involved in cell wall biosynthesis